MAQLRSKDVLQIDATVIAGLLILLTLQSTTQSNFNWQTEDQKTLQSIDQQMAQNEIDYQSSLKFIELLKEKQVNATQENIDRFQKQIDESELKLYKSQSDGEVLLDARDQLLQKGVIAPKGWTNETWIKITAILMALPFIASAMWEILDTFGKKIQDEKASKMGRIFMIMGFLTFFFGLSQIEKLIIG